MSILPDKPVILLGPTCVGKTSASVMLAKYFDTEIISTDSMQIYRHMDIGTAKPGIEERRGVKHHMIDIVEPHESYSTGRYIEDVGPVIDSIVNKGKTPLLVGGTGLYIRAMTEGLFSAPDTDWAIRDRLISDEKSTPGSLYERLKHVDPDTAQKVTPRDLRRIIRALEVYISSGAPVSKLRSKLTKPLPYEFIKICLVREREELYAMIEKRVDIMIASGLKEEVIRLMELNPSQTPMQAIGYKEMKSHLDGEITLDEAVENIKKATRRFAKRQFIWFRREKDLHRLDITGIFDEELILKKILNTLVNA